MASGEGEGKPRDASVIENLLHEQGITEYEPQVVQLLLEFSYRYVVNVLEDAHAYSTHAGKKELDQSDIKLAIENRMDHSFTSPPPRDFLIEMARQKNSTPLPLIPEKFGPRLPPERYCLTGSNYKVKGKKKEGLVNPQVTMPATYRLQTTKPVVTNRTAQSPLLQTAASTTGGLTITTTNNIISSMPKL